MKHPILTQPHLDNTISGMWNRIQSIPETDASKAQQIENAKTIEEGLRKQYAAQEKALPALWEAANIINPENPLAAALSICANAERLKTVIKSYAQ